LFSFFKFGIDKIGKDEYNTIEPHNNIRGAAKISLAAEMGEIPNPLT